MLIVENNLIKLIFGKYITLFIINDLTVIISDVYSKYVDDSC